MKQKSLKAECFFLFLRLTNDTAVLGGCTTNDENLLRMTGYDLVIASLLYPDPLEINQDDCFEQDGTIQVGESRRMIASQDTYSAIIKGLLQLDRSLWTIEEFKSEKTEPNSLANNPDCRKNCKCSCEDRGGLNFTSALNRIAELLGARGKSTVSPRTQALYHRPQNTAFFARYHLIKLLLEVTRV